MALEIPNPLTMAFPAWASATAFLSNVNAYVPAQPVEAEWRTWARALVLAPPFQKFALPDPAPFANWREWALAVLRSFTGAQ